MNSPLLLLPPLLVPMVEELLVLILESVEEAKRLLLLLLTTLIVCVAELFGLIMRRAVLCFPSIDVGDCFSDDVTRKHMTSKTCCQKRTALREKGRRDERSVRGKN